MNQETKFLYAKIKNRVCYEITVQCGFHTLRITDDYGYSQFGCTSFEAAKRIIENLT